LIERAQYHRVEVVKPFSMFEVTLVFEGMSMQSFRVPIDRIGDLQFLQSKVRETYEAALEALKADQSLEAKLEALKADPSLKARVEALFRELDSKLPDQ